MPMLGRSAVTALYSDIFQQLDLADEGVDAAGGFTLVLDQSVEVRVDYDDEDALIWLTTPLTPLPKELAPQLLTQMLRLNLVVTAGQPARVMDAETGTVFIQSRIDEARVDFAAFEAALARHLEAAEATRSELQAAGPAGEGAPPPPVGDAARYQVIWG